MAEAARGWGPRSPGRPPLHLGPTGRLFGPLSSSRALTSHARPSPEGSQGHFLPSPRGEGQLLRSLSSVSADVMLGRVGRGRKISHPRLPQPKASQERRGQSWKWRRDRVHLCPRPSPRGCCRGLRHPGPLPRAAAQGLAPSVRVTVTRRPADAPVSCLEGERVSIFVSDTRKCPVNKESSGRALKSQPRHPLKAEI